MNTNYEHARTRALLTCGSLVAPVFFGVALIEILVRPEFDIRKLPISFLSLGSLGWIQDASFATCGLLAALCGLGMRSRLRGQPGSTFGPVLIGLFGIGMLAAGFFHPDPSYGFPPGTPAGRPAHATAHGTLHMAAFFLAFLSLIAAAFVFTRRFVRGGEKGWAVYCIVSALAVPVLMGLSGAVPAWAGVIVSLAGLVLFGWLAIVTAHLKGERRASAETAPARPHGAIQA